MDTNFSAINKAFCRNCQGAIFVCDITDLKSIEMCKEWKNEVEQVMDPQGLLKQPMILCANKSDLEVESPDTLQTREGLQ